MLYVVLGEGFPEDVQVSRDFDDAAVATQELGGLERGASDEYGDPLLGSGEALRERHQATSESGRTRRFGKDACAGREEAHCLKHLGITDADKATARSHHIPNGPDT